MTRTRFARPSRLIAASVAALALVLGGSIFASPAAALGSINLTLVDANSDPITNLDVRLSDGVDNYYDTTDGSGLLDTTDLPAGTYQVYSEDPSYIDDSTPVVVVDDPAPPTTGTLTLLSQARVEGSLPSDAGGSDAQIQFYYYDAGTDTYFGGPVQSIESDGTFDVPIPGANGLAEWGVFFDLPNDVPYLDTFYGPTDDVTVSTTISAGTPGTSTDLGSVSLLLSGLISGVVTDAFSNPLDGASITAVDTTSGGSLTVFSDSSGNYALQVPNATATYEVWSGRLGFTSEWFDETVSSSFTPVELTATTDRVAQNVDFTLDSAFQGISGNTIYRDSSNLLHPLDIDVELFESDGAGTFSPEPTDWSDGSDEFAFADLPDGTYRIGFRDDNGNYTTWSNYFDGVTSVTPTGPNGSCYVEFTTTYGSPDLVFENIVVDEDATADTCDGAPWATPNDGVFTGAVLNIADFDSPVRAYLYSSPDGIELDSALVDPTTGGYSLWGIHDYAGYYVYFETSGTDPFLDTLLGDDGGAPLVLWAGPDENWDAVEDTSYVPIAPFTDRYSNDVTLPDATVFTGTVTSSGQPVEGACVSIESGSDPDSYACTSTAADGSFVHKVPVGDTWYLSAFAFGYDFEYWDDVVDLVDATPLDSTAPGLDPAAYDFDLTGQPTGIFGTVAEANTPSPVAGVTVHVYRPVSGGYSEFTTVVTDSSSTNVELLQADLGSLPSTFRLRFESSTGQWLSLDYYIAGIVSSMPSFVDGPTCFIDVPSLRPGPEYIFVAVYDDTLQAPGTCSAEPAPSSGSTGGGTPPGKNSHHGQPSVITATPTPTPTPTPTVTPTPSAPPTGAPSSTPTAVPADASTVPDFGWLLWLIMVVVVLAVCGAGFVILRRR